MREMIAKLITKWLVCCDVRSHRIVMKIGKIDKRPNVCARVYSACSSYVDWHFALGIIQQIEEQSKSKRFGDVDGFC